ncbi:hypothetical protein C7S18_09905 [Ahniella affigens]|uniref:CSLREA domain-containing protein n=1 Tax=Ahniella affigens TaxID=2021234 RepID=A0A2P1PRM1_9GAMM|nr:choice-of-anchor Q domain-containing protein [Ahniella affigens]AVP97489.1 hypothetical protein C7S18_09905 [Ahniella affigens]
MGKSGVGGWGFGGSAFWLLVSVGWLALAGRGHAASFQVDSTSDAIDQTPGDGVCQTAAGSCTLRAAIIEANAVPSVDTIQVPAGQYVLSIAGRNDDQSLSGDLDVLANLLLTGAGPDQTIIDAAGLDRVFHVASGVNATISAMSIRGGAGVDTGGGIANAGTLAVQGCRIEFNGSDAGPIRLGGGVYNSGALALSVSVIADNRVGASNQVGATGGGIYSLTALSLNGARVENNRAIGIQSLGGGLATSVLLQMSTTDVRGNIATNGAGILQSSGEAFINASSVRDNLASQQGGGIRVLSGNLELVNTSVLGNRANGSGGGLQVQTGDVVLRNVTIHANLADADANASGTAGGAQLNGSSARVLNSILAGNHHGTVADDCSGTLTDSQYNLVQSNSGCVLGTHDFSADPLLAAISDNQGTSAAAPTPTSPAIDAGDPAGCLGTQDTNLVVDQWTTRRPQDGDQDGVERCDLGAIEFVDDALFGNSFEGP